MSKNGLICEWENCGLGDFVVADAHCDTATRLSPYELAFGGRMRGHIDIPRLAEWRSVQFMAFYMGGGDGNSEGAWRQLRQHWRELLFAVSLSGQAEIVRDLAETGEANHKKVQMIAALEGADMLAGAPERLDELYALGFRSMGVFWNNDNAFGCGAAAGRADSGLTAEGRSFLRRLADGGWLIDLAHASRRSFWQAAELGLQPLFVSHTCCDALCGHRRNLTDEQLRAVGESGGIVGIALVPDFLCGGENRVDRVESDRKAGIQDFVRHIRHAAEIAGIEAVALGSDFDGVERLPEGMDGCQSWPGVAALLETGFTVEDVRKIMGGNLVRFLRERGGR